MMGETVEHGCGPFGVAEDLRPVSERQVGGDEQRRVLVKLADQMEQQLAAGLAERQVAEFVDDDDVVAQQRLSQPSATTGRFLLLELIDQIDQVEEPSASTRCSISVFTYTRQDCSRCRAWTDTS